MCNQHHETLMGYCFQQQCPHKGPICYICIMVFHSNHHSKIVSFKLLQQQNTRHINRLLGTKVNELQKTIRRNQKLRPKDIDYKLQDI